MHEFAKKSPIVGAHILYMLNEGDVKEIMQERHRAGIASHHGNDPRDGDIYPGVVVASWGATTANLQVFLDGNDSYWPTSRGKYNPTTYGRYRYFVPAEEGSELEAAGENTEIKYDEFAKLLDAGGDEAVAHIRRVFEPDARGSWMLDTEVPVQVI